MSLIPFSQRDKRWCGDKLGNSNLSLGDYGCTTVCLSLVNNKFGANCVPSDVAAHKDWYTDSGLLLWNQLSMQNAVFEPNGRVYSYNDVTVRSYIKSPEKAVILEVQLPKGGKHWLFGYSISIFGRVMCIDPWTGTVVDIIKKYGVPTGAAYFTKRP